MAADIIGSMFPITLATYSIFKNICISKHYRIELILSNIIGVAIRYYN